MASLGGEGTGGQGGNIRIYSVEEISQQVKSARDEAFGWIRVRGEVSSVSLPRFRARLPHIQAGAPRTCRGHVEVQGLKAVRSAA